MAPLTCIRRDGLAIAYGTFVTLLLSATMVVAGLKAGITPGVSPLVVLCGSPLVVLLRRSGAEGSRFLNLAQVAGSAGMAVVAGVIFAAPTLQVLYLNIAQSKLLERGLSQDLGEMPWAEAQELMERESLSMPEVNVPQNIMACVAGSLIGWGFVGLFTRKFLTDPTLPAPEARACMSMISAATAERGRRPRLSVSLALGLVLALIVRFCTGMALMVNYIIVVATSSGSRKFALKIPVENGPLYFGIGGLLTLPTAILVFAGAVVRLVGDFLLARINPGSSLEDMFPPISMRWVGGGAMTIAVVWSLMGMMCGGIIGRRARASVVRQDDSLLEVSRCWKAILGASVGLGAAMIAVWLFVSAGVSGFSVAMIVAIVVMAALMVPLGAILSLQIGSSASPVSGTVFVTTLALCGVAILMNQDSIDQVPTIVLLLVAACTAVCAANDNSQDYKTLQLCGVAPQEGFVAQLIGLLCGSVVVPVALYIAANAFGLGTDALPAPQGQMFASLVETLLLTTDLPWAPVRLGLCLGVLAVFAEWIGGRCGLQLPAMAFAVGIYLPAESGVGILIGSIFRRLGEWRRSASTGRPCEQTHECVLAAAGLITGAALFDLALGVAVLCGAVPEGMTVFSSDTDKLIACASERIDQWKGVDRDYDKACPTVYMPEVARTTLAILAILFLGGVLFANSAHGVGEGEQQVSPAEKNSDRGDTPADRAGVVEASAPPEETRSSA